MAVNGERTYHTTNAPYVLPNDPTEHERLELQTLGLNRMMHGQPNHALAADPARILEIGCGTGIMTPYFASNYPTAVDVIGIDISPVPEQPSPSRATFVQGDFRQLAGNPQYPQMRSGSFDYVFSRNLLFGMTDWPGYIAQSKDMLKPGGWLELQELELYYYDLNRRSISGSWKWLRDQTAAWADRGLDIRVGPKLERYMQDAGFVDVHVKDYRWVYGRWEGHPETDMVGDYSPKYLLPVNIGAYRKVLGPTKTVEELATDEGEMQESMKFTEDGKYTPFYVVYERKP